MKKLHARFWKYDGNCDDGCDRIRYDPNHFGIKLIATMAYISQQEYEVNGVCLDSVIVRHHKGDSFGHQIHVAATKEQWDAVKYFGKNQTRKVKIMKFTEIQQTYLEQNPLESALTMPVTWDYADPYLNENEVSSFIQNWVQSLAPEIKEIGKKRSQKNPEFFYKKLKAQELALEFAKKQGLIQERFEPQFQSIGKGIILWEIEQGCGTYDEALKIAIQHDLYTVSNPIIPCKDGYITGARAGWDLQARKQIEDFSLDLYGDDRGWGEGAYFLVLTYNNAEANEVFELENCGI